MPEFRGPKNLHLGFPVWAESKYDADVKEYVIELEEAAAKKFRALEDAAKHGFREVEKAPEPEPEKAPAPKE
jgi:hypothetical protein